MKTLANTTKSKHKEKYTNNVSLKGNIKQFVGLTDSRIATLDTIANSPANTVTQKVSIREENEPVQAKANKTGLPDNLKTGVENLSGYSMDDVKVHYNSDRPTQLNAHAYAQGTDIHLGSGQEKHLPHEAWHVVQQKQGRVKPTTQMKGGVNVNDDIALEKEADVMGEKAIQMRLTTPEKSKTQAVRNTTFSLKRKVHLSPTMKPVIQRLKVQNTDWSKVSKITASTDGVGGVLFMSDASGKMIVVKPNVPGDEEMASAHAHAGINGKGKLGQWKVRTLDSRIAQNSDVGGIRVARQRVEQAHGTLVNRAATLMDAVAAGTTLIQKTAGQDSGSIKDKMINQSKEGHIIAGNQRHGTNKDKVKDNSPLKPLMKDSTGFVRSLGRLAAADLLVGNFDRLADAANLENLLINNKSKSIHPIDNTGGTAVARLLTNGGGTVADVSWTGHRLVAPFIAGNYNTLADEAWADGGMAMTTIYNELIDGFEGDAGADRKHTVTDEEKDAVKTKIARHITHIKIEYAKGIEEGKRQLKHNGQIPSTSGVVLAARQQYKARIDVL